MKVIMSDLVSAVDLDEIFRRDSSVIRAGVIPYAIKDAQIIWLMGWPKKKLGDFGGCKNSRNETGWCIALIGR